MEFLKKIQSFQKQNIETLSQRQNMEDIFSSSQYMVEDVGSYLKWWKIT